MNLYIVNFSYFDINGEDVVDDYWLIGAGSFKEVDEIVQFNMNNLREYRYEPIHYSMRKYTVTDNDFKIIVSK